MALARLQWELSHPQAHFSYDEGTTSLLPFNHLDLNTPLTGVYTLISTHSISFHYQHEHCKAPAPAAPPGGRSAPASYASGHFPTGQALPQFKGHVES